MGLFDQSPWEQLTGRKSPVEVAFPVASKKIGTVAQTLPMIGAVTPMGAVGGVWNAIGTTGKVAVGLGGGYLLGSIFGGGKKQEQTQSFAPQNPIQKNYSYQYSPQTTTTTNITGDWSTNFIYSSPGASIKKGNIAGQAGPVSPTLAPVLTASPSQSASQQGSQGQGRDWATLAAIAGVALVAYGYTSRKGAK